jgi:WD40 repeat protein
VADVADKLNPAASFSPDGKLLLLAWGSKSAQLRDADTGQVIRQFTHASVVYHAAFSSDGRYVVTSSQDGTARVWDVTTGKQAGAALEHSAFVAWSQFSSDGAKLLTVSARHDVQLWDWRNGRPLAPLIPRRSELYHASLSADGSTILTTAWSGYAHLYDATSSRLMSQVQQSGGLVDATFSPDGHSVATACADGNAWIFPLGDVLERPMVLPQGNHIEQIAYDGKGRIFAVAGRGGLVRVWDLSPPESGVRRLAGNDVQWVEFDASGNRALVLSTRSRSSLGVYDVKSATLVSSATLKSNEARAARFSPDGDRIAAFGGTPSVLLFDVDSGRRLRRLTHRRNVYDALWSLDGKLIFTAAGAAGVHAWDTATGAVRLSFTNSSSVRAIALSVDGAHLAIACEDKTVEIRNSSTGWSVGRTLASGARIHQIGFSPDSKLLAISSDAQGHGVVEIRNVASGELIGEPLVHRDTVGALEFSRDSGFLATGCDDHTARVWNTKTGAAVSPWLPQDFEIMQVCFSPDSYRLLTRARRGGVRLWSARTGEPITAPILYPRNVGEGYVSYSPGGERLLLARGANEAVLRELQPEPASLEELTLLARIVSCTRFEPAAGMVPLDEASLNEAWQKLRAIRGKQILSQLR